VAIANSRLLDLKDGMLSFRYKDRQNNILKQTNLSAVEFIRRFLPRTLPQGFVRICHYGFPANRKRTACLTLIQRLLNFSLRGYSASFTPGNVAPARPHRHLSLSLLQKG